MKAWVAISKTAIVVYWSLGFRSFHDVQFSLEPDRWEPLAFSEQIDWIVHAAV